MNDSAVARHLNENFICTYKQVAVFRASQLEDRSDSRIGTNAHVAKQGGNVCSYFCTPEGRVVEMVVGPVLPERLLDSAQRSSQFYESIKRLNLNQQILRARKHLLQLVSNHGALDVFKRKNEGSLWDGYTPTQTGREPNSRNIAESVYHTLHELTFGNMSIRKSTQEVFLNSWNQFGQMREHAHSRVNLLYMENLFLAEMPLAKIEDIERDVFHVLVGQPYRATSPEYEAKLTKFTRLRSDKKHILAILLDVPSDDHAKTSFVEPDVQAIRSFNAIRNQTDDYGLIVLTYDELFGILSDSGLPPLSSKHLRMRQIRKRGVGFVLFDMNGHAKKVLPSGTDNRSLGQAMRRLVD